MFDMIFFLVEFTHSCRGTIYHIPPWEKENHLQKWLGRGYVSSLRVVVWRCLRNTNLTTRERKKNRHVVPKKNERDFPESRTPFVNFKKNSKGRFKFRSFLEIQYNHVQIQISQICCCSSPCVSYLKKVPQVPTFSKVKVSPKPLLQVTLCQHIQTTSLCLGLLCQNPSSILSSPIHMAREGLKFG